MRVHSLFFLLRRTYNLETHKNKKNINIVDKQNARCYLIYEDVSTQKKRVLINEKEARYGTESGVR